MHFRDRIRELRRVPAGELVPNPRNWRLHLRSQREALQGLLEEVGYADALLARELPDGRMLIIDGHLRAEMTPQAQVPVLVLDVTEAEADKLLATIDPLAALAGTDREKLASLVGEVETTSVALQQMLKQLADAGSAPAASDADEQPQLPEQFHILVTCENEEQQVELLTRFSEEGLSCRAFVV